jgi:hypothetical protein
MIVQAVICVLLILFFFLPWMQASGFGGTVSTSGASVFPELNTVNNMSGGQVGYAFIYLLLYLIPVFAAVCLVLFFLRQDRRLQQFFISLCLISLLGVILVVCLYFFSGASQLAQVGMDFGYWLGLMGYGLWITLALAAGGLIISAAMKTAVSAPWQGPAPGQAPSGYTPGYAPPRRFGLFVVEGEYKDATIDIPDEGVVIGRDSSMSNLILYAKDISRRHCFIAYNQNRTGLVITDYSTNGTFIDKVNRLNKGDMYCLMPGQRVYLGNKHQVFEVREV